MSHFTVMVIGANPEKQLVPYQENNMDDCPKQYLKFNDVEAEYREEYKNDGCDMVESPDGERFYPWDNRFKTGSFPNEEKVIPSSYKEIHVKHSDRYKDFETFIKDWAGYTSTDENGKYGYWENPNAKWDWFVLGGRWRNFFKVDNGRADQCVKSSIDFDGMKKDASLKAEQRWDTIEKLFKGKIPRIEKTWEQFQEDKSYEDMDARRKAYHSQPAQLQHQELKKEMREVEGQYTKEEIAEITWLELSSFTCSKEDFIKKAMSSSIATFAVLKDGKWYEKGEMGWWSCVTNEKDQSNWNEEVDKLLMSIPEDTLVSLYDCHI